MLALAIGDGWTPVGTVHAEEELPADEATLLRFHQWTTGPGVRPVGLLNRLRATAYPASQAARAPHEP